MALLKKSAICDDRGFAFVAALLAMLILVSLGVLIFTLTTRDVRVTIKLMGEKKAFSAAENGIHRLMQKFDPLSGVVNPDPACAGLGGYFRVAGSGTDTCYTYTLPTPATSGSSTVNMAGYSITGQQNFGLAPYDSGVTGTNTNYMSQVAISLGIGYGPVDSSLPGYR